MEASLLSPPDPSKRRSTLLRPFSIASRPSVRSRSSTITDTQYAPSALDADDASSNGLLTSGTWARFGRRSREVSEDPDNSGAEFAYGGPGWWKHQMLADRSFRAMAAVTTLFALIMVIICLVYLKDLAHRSNKASTSVGGIANKTCSSMEGRNVVIHLVINLAATMVLGMSNTYQQLITSLSTKELRFALSNVEDSRVGTNSPFNINHKQNGKVLAWLQWILLIGTSLPIHFLANSVIGPSVYLQPPTNITSTLVEELGHYQSLNYGSNLRAGLGRAENPGDRACWVAFRTGHYTISQSPQRFGDDLSSELEGWQVNSVAINYTEPCVRYSKSTTVHDLWGKEFFNHPTGDNATLYSVDDCGYGRDVSCYYPSGSRATLQDGYNDEGLGKQMCRLSVRMSAALILAGCLSIKAVYMVTVILQGRGKIKTKCLTFGDVIAASTLDPSLQIRNECMVNAFDGHRHLVQHTCHPKHCRPGAEPSETGDSIGHCQKCKKFNETNRAADLLHPSIAIKYKKSLIANLGGNAITQMAILMLSSMAMFGVSVLLGVLVASAAQTFQARCSGYYAPSEFCRRGQAHFLKYTFGYFGGFDTAARLGGLRMNSGNSEITAFAISNGAQLLYSLIYLLLIYNFTLITMEHDWGKFERARSRLRCTLVEGEGFKQSYLLQLPKKLLYPMMFFSSMMHWLLGQSISTKETIWSDRTDPTHPVEYSRYDIVYGAYAIWLSTALMLAQTAICWWAFTYSREGFMPQMYGSIRACCASTTQLASFPRAGIKWGDLGEGKKFRHAGFSAEEVDEIIPAELYCGLDSEEDDLKKLERTGEGHDGLKRRKAVGENVNINEITG
ncbi:MAG: hypothetical protein Q9224_003220 [Gallowayella concinna]